MDDSDIRGTPEVVAAIIAASDRMGFDMVSEPKVGSLLSALAASKPAGRFLELGTGTGHGTAWLLAGMDVNATLDTVDSDPDAVAVAQRHLGSDPRVTFHLMDGSHFLDQSSLRSFDLIYADAWPGKFDHLDDALSLLRPGGIYAIDDLLPQSNWPEGHAPKVPVLIDAIERRVEFITVKMAWASGLMLVMRRAC